LVTSYLSIHTAGIEAGGGRTPINVRAPGEGPGIHTVPGGVSCFVCSTIRNCPVPTPELNNAISTGSNPCFTATTRKEPTLGIGTVTGDRPKRSHFKKSSPLASV